MSLQRNMHYIKVGKEICSTLIPFIGIVTLLEAGTKAPDFYSSSYVFLYELSLVVNKLSSTLIKFKASFTAISVPFIQPYIKSKNGHRLVEVGYKLTRYDLRSFHVASAKLSNALPLDIRPSDNLMNSIAVSKSIFFF